MKKIFLVLILLSYCFLHSCNEENLPPECTIVSPLEGDDFIPGDVVNINSDVTDQDGEITSVRVLINDNEIAALISSPYIYSWKTDDIDKGSYNLKVIAKDNEGAETIDEIGITIAANVQAPEAAFSYTPENGNAPLSVQFVDQSLNNPICWQWDFGDGDTSHYQNPIHIYSSPGEYTVSLCIENIAGSDTLVLKDIIHVDENIVPGDAPVAGFIASPINGLMPLEVNFSDESLNNPQSWLWQFGDGNTSQEQNPSHIYEEAGTYTVSLTVTNEFGLDTKTYENLISVEQGTAPVSDFSCTNNLGLPGLEVSFFDRSLNDPQTWIWDFGDGNISYLQDPVHQYDEVGTYTVSLNVVNLFGSDVMIKEDLITVTEMPVADFYGDPTYGIAPVTVSFTDNSLWALSWFWDFGDGVTSTEQNPVHTYENVGFYTVSLKVTNELGINTKVSEDYINVTAPPPTMTDIDGNVYNSALIGHYFWTTENLKVTHYPDGVPILHAPENEEWEALTELDGAYCYHYNDPESPYGVLYTFAAATAQEGEHENFEGQGICPDGWRMPTDEDWKNLEGAADTQYPIGDPQWEIWGNRGFDAAVHLKAETSWNNGGNGDDITGFSALAAGLRGPSYPANFSHTGKWGYWWTATKIMNTGIYRELYYDENTIKRIATHAKTGMSIRCIKNND